MQIEQQVVSLELAQKLKGLGVKQESIFWFGKIPKDKKEEEHYMLTGDRQWAEMLKDRCAAFTVAELGEMLPHYFSSHKCVGRPPQWECCNEDLSWHCNPKKEIYREATHADTEADARAEMLIYLIEHNLIKL